MEIKENAKILAEGVVVLGGGLIKWLAFCLLVMAWGAAFVLTTSPYFPAGIALGVACGYATKWAMDRY